jgi:DNA-binding transcriptional LysR family regulator
MRAGNPLRPSTLSDRRADRIDRSQYAVYGRLPLALRSVTQGFPGTQVVLTTGDPHKLLEDVRDDLLDVAVVSLPAPVSGLRVIQVGFERAVAAVPSNLDRDQATPLELIAAHKLLTLPRRRNPAFYDSLVAALLAAGISRSLVESGAVSLESLLIEVAGGAGCAIVPESTMTRLRTPGVTFRRISDAPSAGCRIAAVTSSAAWTPHVAALIMQLSSGVPERSLIAA